MVEIFDNIRAIYNFNQPCIELSNYIEFFSESSFEETQKQVGSNCFTVKMFPSFTPTIYINLGTPYNLITGNAVNAISANDDVLILRNNIVERQNLPHDHIFTIKFYPGALEALLGIDQKLFIDKVIPACNVIPKALLHMVKQAPGFADRVGALQSFFLSKLHKAKQKSHYLQLVEDVVMLYTGGGMQYNNAQLAQKMFTTSKTINRYFNNVVGTTPKNYFTILRARHALTGYVAGIQRFDASIYGYYDMSHFYKDVVKFTGRKLHELVE